MGESGEAHYVDTKLFMEVRMKQNKKPCNSAEMLLWKMNTDNQNEKKGWPSSPEQYNSEYASKCGGIKYQSDVLYSFLGIYSIGVYALFMEQHPERIKIGDNKIYVLHDWIDISEDGSYFSNKPKPDKMTMFYYWQILGSSVFLNQIQEKKLKYELEIEKLNKIIQPFVDVYFNAGNIIPIWPGGNTLKGNQNNGFMDVPEIFFNKFYDWFHILKQHKEAHFEQFDANNRISDKRFSDLKLFLNTINNLDDYKKYIDEIVNIIKVRDREIKQ